jgi:hypothetical protein
MSKKILFLVLLLSTVLTVLACTSSGFFNNKPEDVVKEYWNYVLKGELKNAEDLVCQDFDCGTSEVRTESKSVGTDGKTMQSSGGAVIESCCEAKIIAQSRIVLTNVNSVLVSRKYAEVIVDAKDYQNNNWQFINCLAKDSFGEWKLTKVRVPGSYKPIEDADACLVRYDNRKNNAP